VGATRATGRRSAELVLGVAPRLDPRRLTVKIKNHEQALDSVRVGQHGTRDEAMMSTTPVRSSRSSTAPPPEPDVRNSPLEVRPPTPDALCIETPLASLETPVTPVSQFFVRNHFAVPQVDLEDWRLAIEGHVERPRLLTYEEIRGLPHRPLRALIECAGNSRSSVRPHPEGVLWRNGAVSTGEWVGTPLRDLLELAKVRPGAVEVLLEGLDHGKEPGLDREIHFGMSITTEKAMDPDTLLVDEMNGNPLSPRHGFPLRAIVPGWYGMASVKWLSRIVVLHRPFDGYFRTRAYAFIPEGEAADAPHRPVSAVRVKSLVTWPKEGSVLSTGLHRIRGVAWSGVGRIVRVEVSVGGMKDPLEEETWHSAVLTDADSPYSWSHWEYPRELDRAGFYVIRVRATDEKGNVQPPEAKWNFRGLANNSVHQVPVEVRSNSGAPAN
jgi:DMSO/TMAO reductase YedYZ molybdopterin-dependent catalytic subunit